MGIGADNAVDLNSIPLAMVERVEVLKDGASTVYGSDAIGGVVNIITRKDFNGTEVELYAGSPQNTGCNTALKADGSQVDPNCGGPGFTGNGFNYDASFVTGTQSKNGGIVFSAGFQKQNPVFAGDRSWAHQAYTYDFGCDPRTGIDPSLGNTPINATNPAQNPNGAPSGVGLCNQISGSTAIPNGFLDPGLIINAATGMPVNFGANGLCGVDSMSNPLNCMNGPTASRMPGAVVNPKALVPFVEPQDDYNFAPVNYLLTPSQRYNVYSEGHYNLTDRVDAFFEALYVNRSSSQLLAPEPLFTIQGGVGGAAIPITGGLDANGNLLNVFNPYNDGTLGAEEDIFDYRRRLEEFGPRESVQTVDTFRVVAGLEGRLPENLGIFRDWKWEVSYNYGRTDATNVSTGDLILSHLEQAIGPSFNSAAGPQCGSPTAPLTNGCVPIDILGPAGSISPASKSFVTFTGVQNGFTDQRVALAQTHGQLAKTPGGGDLSAAVGVDYRRESGGVTPDPLTVAGDTTGDQQLPTLGSYYATEAFGELSFVPVANKKFAEWLEFDLSGRYSDYNTFGSQTTGKAGFLFRTAGGFAIRGTYSTAFRAPSFSDLFSGVAVGFPAIDDPCDANPPGQSPPTMLPAQCTANQKWGNVPVGAGGVPITSFGTSQQRDSGGGNPNLQPETATIATGGLVWEPIHGLGFTVDYWDITINQGITAYGPLIILSDCYSPGTNISAAAQQEFCQDITRDPTTHAISNISDSNITASTIATDGIDASGSYDFQKKGFGRLRTQVDMSWLHKWDLSTSDSTGTLLQTLHCQGNYDCGFFPAFRGVLSVLYTGEHGFGAGLIGRYVGTFHECDTNVGGCNLEPQNIELVDGQPHQAFRDVGRYAVFNLFVNYSVKSRAGQTTITVGVNNIADTPPPFIFTAFANNSDPSVYDFLGRYYYIRLNQAF